MAGKPVSQRRLAGNVVRQAAFFVIFLNKSLIYRNKAAIFALPFSAKMPKVPENQVETF